MISRDVEYVDRIDHALRESLAITDALTQIDPFKLQQTTVPVLAEALANQLREVRQLVTEMLAAQTGQRKESEE